MALDNGRFKEASVWKQASLPAPSSQSQNLEASPIFRHTHFQNEFSEASSIDPLSAFASLYASM